MRILFLIITTILIFNSCTREVNLDFKDFETNVVVNCLMTPDSVFKVRLSESLRSDKEEIFNVINNAEVEITDGKALTKLSCLGNGVYSAPVKPVPGNDYGLRVVTSQGKIISSLTRVPVQTVIKVTPLINENQIQINIVDDPNEKNYYWVGQKTYAFNSKTMEYETYISSDYLSFDDFNRSKNEDITGKMTYSYHFYARLEDSNYNGRKISFCLPRIWPNPDQFKEIDYTFFIYIINADQHLDQYMKSAIMQYELGVIGDMPVFYTPVNIYSNISNGKGIFGSYTISQFDITVP